MSQQPGYCCPWAYTVQRYMSGQIVFTVTWQDLLIGQTMVTGCGYCNFLVFVPTFCEVNKMYMS